MIDMMQKFCRGRRLGVPFSVYLYTWFGLPWSSAPTTHQLKTSRQFIIFTTEQQSIKKGPDGEVKSFDFFKIKISI